MSTQRNQALHSFGTPSELRSKLDRWFRDRGFRIAEFEKGKLRISTYRMGEMIVFKLSERSGHTTYYKEATGGALIVFEVAVADSISYEGYCPLLLFGMWAKKVTFKQGAGVLTKYRDEGYHLEQKLLEFLRSIS